jgi:hypothetical protein
MSKPVEVELRSLMQDASSDEHAFSYARTGLKLTTFRHAWEGACKQAGALRLLVSRSAAYICDSFAVMSLLGSHHFADDVSLQSCDPGESRTAVDSLIRDHFRFVREARQDRANWRMGRMETDRL